MFLASHWLVDQLCNSQPSRPFNTKLRLATKYSLHPPTGAHQSANMAKDRESSKPSHAQPEKEEKKKKKKRSEEEGVHKKDKKEKKVKREALAERALNEIRSASAAVEAKSDDDEAGETTVVEVGATSKEVLRPVGALVPFANPLADEKVAKKVFKSVKKGTPTFFLSTVIKMPRLPTQPLIPGLLEQLLDLYLLHIPFPLHLPFFLLWLTNPPQPHSRRTAHSQTRRERSRESATQIHPINDVFLSTRRRRSRRRHLAYGRHLAHSRAVRRPPHPVYLRDIAGGAWHGGPDEAAHERGHGCWGGRGSGGEEDG